MSSTKLLTGVDAGVLTLTLDGEARRNALNDEVMAGIDASLDRAEQDPAIRAVVLAAVGTAFCAGMDVGQVRSVTRTPDDNLKHAMKMADSMIRLATLSKPTIAAVQGSAYGGGVGLVAACDIAIAVDGARFTLSEVRLGLLPGLVAPMMAAAVGTRTARRLLLTGESIDAQEALRLGLLHQVVAAEGLASAVAETARRLKAGSPVTIAATKRLLDDPKLTFPDPASVRPMAELVMAHRKTADAQEGIKAFLEKRKPSWTV